MHSYELMLILITVVAAYMQVSYKNSEKRREGKMKESRQPYIVCVGISREPVPYRKIHSDDS